MNKLKIAMCQMEVVDSKEENLKKVEVMIDESKNKGADIVVLPEMFICPYQNEKFIEYCESQDNSPTLKVISKIAKNLDIHIIAGSIPEMLIDKNGDRKIYNSSFFFDNNGKLLGFHRKLHLFDIDIKDKIYFKESDTLSAGSEITVIDSKLGRFGIAICFDIRFPELSAIMTLKRAEILIFPGAFNLTTGPLHWRLLLRARAVDNQVFTVGISQALNENQSYHAYGHSLVVNPLGEVVAEASSREELLIAEIDLDEIAIVREELPVIKNKRDDLYQLKF
ncbi:MAG: carbon-nitrogen hydrolase family protein [Methanobrevibacter sp.]|jgi:predicted amidohydrolase|nr:carbon-nitrogen hydrolase family protein [Candidatus Methanovirga basalitermitum]